MFAVFASYRGRSRRRAEYVEEVTEAFANADSVLNVEQVGVEDLLCHTEGAEETLAVVLSLIQAGDFAIGIGRTVTMAELYPESAEEWEELAPHEQMAATGEVARRAIRIRQRPGEVSVRLELPGSDHTQAPGKGTEIAEDVAAAFTLIAHVLARRTKEGREATALLRSGYSQSEAAEVVGISTQAMSQRLASAGWQAEQAGWNLAVHMLARVDELG